MPTHKTAAVNGESGFTLIDLLFTASLICLIATMAVPGLLRARGAAQSSSAVGTLRALEEALLNFAGCAVVISHDRWFLDRIATHMLAFEGDSKVVWFEGNYQDYEADRHRRLGAEADQPHRIKFRKLTR